MNTGDLYRRAWSILPHTPLPVVYAMANAAADLVWRRNGGSVRQLRRNYEQFLGRDVPESMVRGGVRSYFRAFAEQFTLPGWDPRLIRSAMVYPGAAAVKEMMEEGPVVLALTHSGNWDVAGAWFAANHGRILTVAEKLEPPELFDQFVEFRESLGMDIIGVGPGEHVFGRLVERARDQSVFVPLLADRDISGSGIEVDLGANRALVAAGPAALAIALDRPLIAGHMSYRRIGKRWIVQAHFTDPIPRPSPRKGHSEVEAWTQAWVDALRDSMAEHLVDWHMMQKVFVDDLDPARLERARARAASERSGASAHDHPDTHGPANEGDQA